MITIIIISFSIKWSQDYLICKGHIEDCILEKLCEEATEITIELTQLNESSSEKYISITNPTSRVLTVNYTCNDNNLNEIVQLNPLETINTVTNISNIHDECNFKSLITPLLARDIARYHFPREKVGILIRCW